MQTVAPEVRFGGIDRHAVEKGVQRGAQAGHQSHGGGVVFAREKCVGLGEGVEGVGKSKFLGLLQQRGIGRFVVRAVLAFLDAEDVGGATIGGQEVGSVVGREETRDGVGAGEEADDVVVGAGGEDGRENVVAGAFGAELDAQAVGEEVENFGRGAAGFSEQPRQLQAQVVVTNDADDAEGSAAEGVGVTGASGFLADGEEAGELVQLVRQGDRDGDGRGGNRVVGAFRGVLVTDGVGDGAWFAVVQGVIAAHNTLKFREFANHAAGQVGLCEFRGTIGLVWIGADMGRDRAGKGPDAPNALGLGAEFGVERDGVEGCDAG